MCLIQNRLPNVRSTKDTPNYFAEKQTFKVQNKRLPEAGLEGTPTRVHWPSNHLAADAAFYSSWLPVRFLRERHGPACPLNLWCTLKAHLLPLGLRRVLLCKFSPLGSHQCFRIVPSVKRFHHSEPRQKLQGEIKHWPRPHFQTTSICSFLPVGLQSEK